MEPIISPDWLCFIAGGLFLAKTAFEGLVMRKTEGATKAHASVGYWKHLRSFGKRLANKATRRTAKRILKEE